MTIPDGLEPLGVWDLTHGTLFKGDDNWEQLFLDACFWWADHLDDDGSIGRVEFYLIDAPFAVVYRHDATGKIATEPPVIVPLDQLPPPHLLGTP